MPHSEFWPFSCNFDESNEKEGSSVLHKQIGQMEGQVKEIQMELAAIRKDRINMHGQKQTQDSNSVVAVPVYNDAITKVHEDHENELSNLPQLAKLKEELIRAKNSADEERYQREKYEGKLKDLELKLNSLCNTGIVEESKKVERKANEDIVALKTQLRDVKEELEEMKISITEKDEQLQEYRIKYLQAEQQAEEMKRHVDMIEYDNKQVSDQIQIEIQKMKMQFQEKLQELAPLPDLLKGSQIQLQEARQLQKLAEDSSQQLSTELNKVKEKLIVAVSSLNQEKAEKIKYIQENKSIKADLEEKLLAIDDLVKNVEEFKCRVLRLEEKLNQEEARYKEKAVECAHLIKELDEQRSENSRVMARSKDRSDSMRRYMQTQISELERQLIQSRAQGRTCQKDRDDMRQRMQIQINSLQENFELVEIRLRGLQGQIISLKNSYAVILTEEGENSEYNKLVTTCD